MKITLLKCLNLQNHVKKIYPFYRASNPLMISHYLNLNFTKLNPFIHPSLSTILTIVQNKIFTFTLDGEELEKYLFVIIMNVKRLTCFIILH